jgi:hypothetical protein
MEREYGQKTMHNYSVRKKNPLCTGHHSVDSKTNRFKSLKLAMNEEQYIVFDQYLQGELSREELTFLEKT